MKYFALDPGYLTVQYLGSFDSPMDAENAMSALEDADYLFCMREDHLVDLRSTITDAIDMARRLA